MRSILNKTHLLEALLDERPDLNAVCITESWLAKGKIDLLQINGYFIASSFCRQNHEGGCVCILLKEHTEYKEREDIVKLSIEFVIELCAIEIPSLNILIITVYWPDNSREIDLFHEHLEKLLQLITSKDKTKSIIIGGDLNVDFLTNNKQKQALTNLMSSFNFKQNVKEATRVTCTTKTCIDTIFSNFKLDIQPKVCELGFSDHKGVLVTLPKISQNPNKAIYYMEKRIFNGKNVNYFMYELQQINWNTIIRQENNINTNYNIFENVLKDILNKCIPKKSMKIKENSKNTWITKGLRNSCKNKRLLKLLVLQTDDQVLHRYYKTYEKTLKILVNKCKKLNNAYRIKNSSNKVRTMWQIVNEQTKKHTKRNQNIVLSININNKIISDPHSIACEFNQFLASIGGTFSNCDNQNIQSQTLPQTNSIQNSFYLSPAQPQEVYNIIKNLKNKNSCGIDELPPKLIRKCADLLTVPYTNLINQSFMEGAFPDALKISIVKPIYKKGDKCDLNNYRPIALLPTSAKIFESAMSKRLYSFCEKFHIFDDSQYGFRKNRSTDLAIYKFTQKILNIINEKKYAIGILLDMSKAYDRISHNILLKKLHNIGIRGVTHRWFRTYLQNREQYTQIETINKETGDVQKIMSNKVQIKNSIPQGSVLACILFIIYINDLPKILKDQCVLFADDISIVFPCCNVNYVNDNLDIILNKVNVWLDQHQLQLNLEKTKIIQFKPYQKKTLQIMYYHKNILLDSVQSAKLLGIELDSGMTWKAHIQKLNAKLSTFIYALCQIKRTTDLATCLTIYYAYAHSWLKYGVILWGNSSSIAEIFTLQKRCLRIIANIKPTDSCRPHFIKFKILTLVSMYILEACKFVRKNSHLYSPLTGVKRNNRNEHKLRLPTSKLQIFTSGPHCMAIKMYNKIPNEIKRIEKPHNFNKQLKQYLELKCYYNLQEFFDDKN